MPRPRILLPAVSRSSHYHCISRVVDRNFVFGTMERDVFRKILRQVEAFSGVRVITWTILSNHFHVLLEVPPEPGQPLTDDEILERCRSIYTERSMDRVIWEFENAQQLGGGVLSRLRQKYLRRMWDLSEFMLTLKQKFTFWFNRKQERVGTLWEARFKSVIVEGEWSSLLKVAAYIDLNAVRAGMVASPEDYRWSGYGEAVAGDRRARRGLSAALSGLKPGASWRDVAPRYRKMMFGLGEETSVRVGLSREAVAEVWRNGGKLSLAQLLRCRIRYFTDGVAIGSASFVEEVFKANPSAFSSNRQSGARRIPGGGWGAMRAARALRVNPIAPSGDG